jgi:hypothetical protein
VDFIKTMPRLSINLLPYREAITEWARTNVNQEEIANRLKDLYGISVDPRTVRRRLQEWNVQTRTQTADTPFLRAQIAILYRLGDTDEEMLEDLEDCGYTASITGVVRIRKKLGLIRRMTTMDRQAADEQLFAILQSELNDGRVAGYGRRHLHAYFRQQGLLVTRSVFLHFTVSPQLGRLGPCLLTYFVVYRESLYAMLRLLDPEAIALRMRRMQSKKGEYIVPGPDWIWSIDGHDKLSPFGIEIYACIDAYSRNIIWVYVGISNRTAHSVVQQYLQICAQMGYCPHFFRADRGSELPLVAEAHFAFSRIADPSVVRVEDCFISGKSTENQRVESWWQELQKSQLYRWRVSNSVSLHLPLVLSIIGREYRVPMITPLFVKAVRSSVMAPDHITNSDWHIQNYFQELAHTGGYNHQYPWDRIALLALYMRRIQNEVHRFADLWNIHRIRKDRSRPNMVAGKPFRLYTRPPGGAQRWGRPVDMELCDAILDDCSVWGE